MNEIDKRIDETFDAIHMPSALKESTLAAIDEASYLDNASVAAAAKRRKPHVRLAIAACLALVLVCFGGYQLLGVQSAFVDIDVNPSIELGLNRMNTVVSAKALNDDGEILLDTIDVRGKSYQEAFDTLAQGMQESGYLHEDSLVSVGVMSFDESQSRRVQEITDDSLANLPCEGTCTQVDSEVRSEAQLYGMGVRKYEAALQLIQLDSSVSIGDCQQMTMRQLQVAIESLGGQTDLSNTQNGNGQGNGYGSGSISGLGSGTGKGSGAESGSGLGSGAGSGSGNGSGSTSSAGSGNGSGNANRN